MKIIILFLLLFVLTPAPDAECIDDWAIIRQYENYCDNNGTYTLYVCSIQKERNGELYTTIKFKSECSINDAVPIQEFQFTFLPIMVVEHTTIGEPIVP